MKKILLILCMALLTGCGHNILTNYEVDGLDLSIPIGGYPFGIRLGVVKINANTIRGNATYTANTTTGTEIGSGAVQESTVIQFSSNSQVNEGNVEKIITAPNVSDEVKEVFIKEYLKEQQAPEVLPVTTKTPVAATATGTDPKIHDIKVEQPTSLIGLFSPSKIIDKILIRAGDFFVFSAAGKTIIILAKLLALLIVIMFIVDIIRLIVSKIRNKMNRKD